jgi:hypothetical protein
MSILGPYQGPRLRYGRSSRSQLYRRKHMPGRDFRRGPWSCTSYQNQVLFLLGLPM